jgi:hypothetical protein
LSRWWETMHNKTLCCFFFFFSVYLFSYSFCIHYHPPLCILTCYYYFRVTKDDLVLSLFHTQEENLYLHRQRRCRQCIFFPALLLFSLSLYVDSYLFRFVQERRSNTASQRSAWINFFILSSMHVCVCVLPLTSTHFSLCILSIFPFFTPFCNRQMKVKKECIEYIRRFKDDEAKRHQESSTTFCFFSLFLFFYLSIFFALSSLTAWFDFAFLYCVSKQQQQQQVFRPFSTIVCRPSSCTLHRIYTIRRLFFLALPSSPSLSFFSKKTNTDWLTAFFCGTFYVCMFLCFDCCCSYSLLVPITICMYVCIYVLMYEKKNEKRNMLMKDEKKKKLRTALLL